jgi:hypothetical protein
MTAGRLDPFVRLALGCVHREYPNQVALRLSSDADLRPPRELTPAFYGCYDWHSAVHGHWLLARAVHTDTMDAARAKEALAKSLTAENVARELLYLDPRPGFERPYGLGWLLALHLELVTSGDDALGTLGRVLAPLAFLASGRFESWLPKLRHPIRSGVHSQTAFAMGLVLDWARGVNEKELEALLARRARDYHEGDRDLPLHLEPSGEDFLSPSLGVADLMARIFEPEAFAAWLTHALPELGESSLAPVEVSDPNDGRLAHLDGLNLSRAWMLHAIARALPEDDPRRSACRSMARAHEEAALTRIEGRPYEGTHWLGTFAAYLLTHPARPGTR